MPLLVDQFITKMTQTSEKLLSKRDDRLLRSGTHAVVSAAKLGDKVIFTPGTMLMLADKLRHFQETVEEIFAAVGHRDFSEIIENIQSFRGGWIIFPKPLDNVAAMLFFVPSVYIPTGKDLLQLFLISAQADIIDALEERGARGEWYYQEALHTCQQCKREYGVLVPCPQCHSFLSVWARIFGLSAIIAGQYLAALRYEEKTVTTMRHVPREKSGKERRVPVKHIFKVIDANEIIIPVVRKEEAGTREPRGSWMADGNFVVEEIRTRKFKRTYRSDRYVNVKGQSIEFSEGIVRLQPKRPENLGKTVTKVKASLYEQN